MKKILAVLSCFFGWTLPVQSTLIVEQSTDFFSVPEQTQPACWTEYSKRWLDHQNPDPAKKVNSFLRKSFEEATAKMLLANFYGKDENEQATLFAFAEIIASIRYSMYGPYQQFFSNILPRDVFQFPLLTRLDLRGNNLKNVKGEWQYLENLRDLNLNTNHLVQLPLEIISLPNLVFLHIANNQFQEFPFSSFPKKLEVLSFNNNPWILKKKNRRKIKEIRKQLKPRTPNKFFKGAQKPSKLEKDFLIGRIKNFLKNKGLLHF